MADEQVRNLVHELHTHQIELEMQNEELRLAQEELAREHEKYLVLYDFAPVGYFTLNMEGRILEANLTGAQSLGIERRNLKDKPFTNFIERDDQDIYYRHWQKLLETRETGFCEIRIKRKDRSHFWALISSVMIDAEQEMNINFNMVMTDISQQKRDEEILQNTVHELNQFNRFMVNRETRMIELKQQVNELRRRLGEEAEDNT